jgi:hypothetical protein
MLVNMYTSRLSFQTNAVILPLVFTRMSPLFNFNFLSPKSGCIGPTVPHEFICLVSKSSESLGDEKIVHKQCVSYAFNSACQMSNSCMCMAVMSSVGERESLPKYTRVSYV